MSKKTSLLHSEYRPDIDGLRAIAILSVLLYHAFPEKLRGGFIGVDVFFVISGYLISTIIFENLDNGTFRFGNFYARRIKRIFPALIIVLFSCFVFGWIELFYDEFDHLSKRIFSAALFTSNFALWNGNSYLGNASEAEPLLHLWSLGIEEQFYIIWPVLLFIAWKQKFDLLRVIIFIAAVSFFLNIVYMRGDTVGAFYFPQTRFWELLSGSFLAWVFLYKKNTYDKIESRINSLFSFALCKSRVININAFSNLLSVAGLFLLLYGFWNIDKAFKFPGWWALLPVLSAVLIIMAGPRALVNRIILSRKIFVWLGLISFPLYLWHWPLLFFAKIINGGPLNNHDLIIVIGTSVFLSWLTYAMVEIPVRIVGSNEKSKITILIVLMAIVGCAGHFTHRYKTSQMTYIINNDFNDIHYNKPCNKIAKENYYDDWCNFRIKSENSISVALIGDSFSGSFSAVLNSYADNFDKSFSFVGLGRGQCPNLLDYGPEYCRFITNKSFNYIKNSPSIKMVILASDWRVYSNGKTFTRPRYFEKRENFIAAFEKTLAAYKALGKEVVVFLSPPVIDMPPKFCLTSARPIRKTDYDFCHFSVQKAIAADYDYKKYMIPALDRLGVKYFDPFKYFCNQTECIIREGEKLFYFDTIHISRYGASFLSNRSHKELSKILTR